MRVDRTCARDGCNRSIPSSRIRADYCSRQCMTVAAQRRKGVKARPSYQAIMDAFWIEWLRVRRG